MSLSIITMKQVLVLFVLIFLGYLAVKIKIVEIEAKKAFSNLLLYLVVPCMVIHSYMMEFNGEVLQNLLTAFGWSALLLVMGLVLTVCLTWREESENKPIIQFACTFSNAAYMGFPLIQALFGSEGMIYASAFVTVFNLLLWTYGYAVVSGKKKGWDMMGSIAKTPVIYSVILGLVIYLCQIPVPSILEEPIELVGNMNTPLSMFITGMIVAESDIPKLLRKAEVYKILLIRMVVIPAVCFLFAFLLHMEGMVAQVTFLLEMCPCAAITTVFAVQFGYDEDVAAGSVVFSTLLSIAALPMYAALIQGLV